MLKTLVTRTGGGGSSKFLIQRHAVLLGRLACSLQFESLLGKKLGFKFKMNWSHMGATAFWSCLGS